MDENYNIVECNNITDENGMFNTKQERDQNLKSSFKDRNKLLPVDFNKGDPIRLLMKLRFYCKKYLRYIRDKMDKFRRSKIIPKTVIMHDNIKPYVTLKRYRTNQIDKYASKIQKWSQKKVNLKFENVIEILELKEEKIENKINITQFIIKKSYNSNRIMCCLMRIQNLWRYYFFKSRFKKLNYVKKIYKINPLKNIVVFSKISKLAINNSVKDIQIRWKYYKNKKMKRQFQKNYSFKENANPKTLIKFYICKNFNLKANLLIRKIKKLSQEQRKKRIFLELISLKSKLEIKLYFKKLKNKLSLHSKLKRLYLKYYNRSQINVVKSLLKFKHKCFKFQLKKVNNFHNYSL